MLATKIVRAVAVACLAFATPLGASAQDITGRIIAKIDGNEGEWFVTRQDGKSRSSFTGVEKYRALTIFGHAKADTVSNVTNSLSIQFDLVGTGEETLVQGGTIRLIGERLSIAYISRPEHGTEIALDTIAEEPDTIVIRGNFKAQLGFSGDFGATVHPVNKRLIEGSFAVQLYR